MQYKRLGELVDGGLGDAVGVPLAHPQQPKQPPGHRAERDLRIGDGEPAGGLPGLDVPQRPRRQPGPPGAAPAAIARGEAAGMAVSDG